MPAVTECLRVFLPKLQIRAHTLVAARRLLVSLRSGAQSPMVAALMLLGPLVRGHQGRPPPPPAAAAACFVTASVVGAGQRRWPLHLLPACRAVCPAPVWWFCSDGSKQMMQSRAALVAIISSDACQAL